jgi:uncharacterized phiE125 gp8 family phage protein
MKVSVLTVAPTVEPLTIEEVRDNLKVDDSLDEDMRLKGLIKSARLWCEGYTNRSFIKQTRTQYMDDFWQPCDYRPVKDRAAIELLQGPLLDVAGTTVISVKYYDEDDVLQTLNPSEYWIDSKRPVPRIYVKESWPTTKVRPNAVEIAYWAGFGTTGADVPQYFIDAMHLYIAHFYENRVPEITGTIVARFELGIERLLDRGSAYQNAF